MESPRVDNVGLCNSSRKTLTSASRSCTVTREHERKTRGGSVSVKNELKGQRDLIGAHNDPGASGGYQ